MWVFSVLLLSPAAATLLRRSTSDPQGAGHPGYQQINVNNDGRVQGGSCINWEAIRMSDAGTDGIFDEDLGERGCAEKCEDNEGCTGFQVCRDSSSCTANSCGIFNGECSIHPTVSTWNVYRLIPMAWCNEDLDLDADVSDFMCPMELPIGQGKKKEVQETYFKKMHCSFIHGNGFLPGAKDHTFHERWLKYYGKELECVYMSILDDKQDGGPCGGMKSQNDKRQTRWEATCLSARTNEKDVIDMMEKPELKYYYKMKSTMRESQAYDTYLNLNGDKELMCMLTRMVDDECGAFKSPRFLPPASAKKLLKPVNKDLGKGAKDPMKEFSS